MLGSLVKDFLGGPVVKSPSSAECVGSNYGRVAAAAAAATKSLRLCPTLHDPIDSSPSGSTVLGILQVR